MKGVQTQQTQQQETQQGGSAMFDCQYEKDDREYCDHGTLGNVSVKSFFYSEVYGEFGDEDLAGLIDSLPELEYVMVLEEPCDCWERYGEVKHNDGGNYHSRIRVYEITPCVYLAVYGDTREVFSMDDYKYTVVWVEDQPVGVVVAKSHDCCHLLKREELDGFVKGYEEEGYSIY
ncbi:hypothetical protein [Thermocrinis sp.]|jgi:hypothetical protein|uniref:hypothetical protein n=1 Tax=Thermocrinis sp. TaxID=2024383 RepID=UPI003BFBC2F5